MNILDEFDVSKFYLGTLCSRGHDWNGTGRSLRRIHIANNCVECVRERGFSKKKHKQCDECGRPFKLDEQPSVRSVDGQKKAICVECVRQCKSKPCCRCNIVKPLDQFHVSTRHRDGRKSVCVECLEKERRAKGINPSVKIDYDLLPRLAKELGVDIDSELYYLSKPCANNHTWNNTGYNLKYRSNNHCVECEKLKERHLTTEQKQQHRESARYQKWLKSPRISPTVVELVEKSERWARVHRKELFMSPDEREAYNQKNREAYKKRYLENPEREKLRIKKWKHANPDRIDLHNQRRIERVRLQSDNSVTYSVVDKILEEASHCIYCSVRLTPESATIDHIIPISLGGLHSAYNLIACCKTCNAKKSNKPFFVWMNELDEVHKLKAEKLYRQRYKSSPEQGTLPLVFV